MDILLNRLQTASEKDKCYLTFYLNPWLPWERAPKIAQWTYISLIGLIYHLEPAILVTQPPKAPGIILGASYISYSLPIVLWKRLPLLSSLYMWWDLGPERLRNVRTHSWFRAVLTPVAGEPRLEGCLFIDWWEMERWLFLWQRDVRCAFSVMEESQVVEW